MTALTDAELLLHKIDKFLDGKGKKPSLEQYTAVLANLERDANEHPSTEADNLINTLKVKWEASQGFTPATAAEKNKENVNDGIKTEKRGSAVGDKLKKAAGRKDVGEKPIREGLRFLADNRKFKKKNESVGNALLVKDSLGYDELMLARQILKGYEEDLDPKLYLEILSYKPVKPIKEKPTSKAFEGFNGEFFSTPQGLKFYVETSGIPLEIEGEGFEGLLADRKYTSGDGLPSGEEISSIRRLAKYWASKNIRDVSVRNATAGGAFIYDPVRQDGKVFMIKEAGVKLEFPNSPYTVRYSGMMEAQIAEGTIDDYLNLIRLWHLNKEGEILSMGLDFSRFVPGIPHAIESVDGPHGSGKTAYTETKRMLYDPNGAPTQSLKYDERDLSISALHQGMLAFDNVNAAMPDFISDVLCRFSTGQGFRTRELYSNTGEVIIKLKRPMILNGINRASYRPDFIDRECPTHLAVMPDSRRLTDAEIRAKAEILIPKVRGYLLSIIPVAMGLYSQVESELKGKLPRMADFVIWAECGTRAMGFPALAFFDAYLEVKREEIQEVARDTLLIGAIQSLMAAREEWVGTTSDLLAALEPYVTDSQRKSKGLPKDARRLGRALRELEPTLREVGFELLDLKNSQHERMIRKIVEGVTIEVNSTNSTSATEPTKYGAGKSAINQNSNSEKKLIAQHEETAKDGFQSKSAISAINHEEHGDQKKSPEDRKSSDKPAETTIPNAITSENPITLDQGKDMSETHENPKFYTYVVLKDFKYNGHVYSQGIEFILREKLTDYVNEGILMLKEGPA